MIQKRIEAIKPALPKKLQKLVYNVPKDPIELFADDLEKRIKAIFSASNALTRHSKTGRLRSFGNNDMSKNVQGYQREEEMPKATSKAQDGRHFDTLE